LPPPEKIIKRHAILPIFTALAIVSTNTAGNSVGIAIALQFFTPQFQTITSMGKKNNTTSQENKGFGNK